MYRYPVDELIQAFKYNRRQGLSAFFSVRLEAVVQSDKFLRSADMIVPIPLHPLKRWWRSYNQSALLAESLAKESGLGVAYLLRRNRMTRTQTRLSPKARLKNVQGAFSLRNKVESSIIAGKKLILIDDVITTGSTLDAAAKVLLDAGASQIYGLVVGGAWRER